MMRRFRESGAAAFVVACALIAIAACFDEPVGVDEVDPSFHTDTDEEGGGSHFRYATLSWAPTGSPGEVRFRLVAAFRRTAFFGTRCEGACSDGLPEPGDIFVENQGPTSLNFGDGSPETPALRFRATAVDISSANLVEHWVVGEALDPATDVPGVLHTYSGSGPYTAYLGGFSSWPPLSDVACCRVFATTLENRGNGNYPIQTVVDLSGNSSPTSTMLPIVSVPLASDVEFLIPAGDPDGDELFFRLASSTEAGNGPGDLHPPGLSVDPSTGVVSWNNLGLAPVPPATFPTYWTTQVMIEDGLGTKTPVDFMLKITGSLIGTAPTCSAPAGPIEAFVGSEIAFTVSATDADGDVTLNSGALPAGAVMTPSLPVTGGAPSSTFTWTPDVGQEGTFVFLFSATDTDQQTGLCSTVVEVNIIGPDGGDIPVTDEDGVVQGTVNIPAGALPSNTVIIAEITNDPTCANVDGAEGLCLSITVPSGIVIEPGAFVTVGLCFEGAALPPPEFAIFRTDDDGTVVLQNVLVDLDCGTSASLDVEGNLLSRFASSMWQRITWPFRPQPLHAAFAVRRLGGLSGSFSKFQWAPQLFVQMALAQNNNRADTDMIEIQGVYPFGGVPFDPEGGEGVDINFGDCLGPCVTLSIDGDRFVREGKKYTATDGARNARSTVEIFDNGQFKIHWRGLTIDDIMTVGEDDIAFVSFTFGIGDRLNGVGLEFDDRGRCHRANSAPGCEDSGL